MVLNYLNKIDSFCSDSHTIIHVSHNKNQDEIMSLTDNAAKTFATGLEFFSELNLRICSGKKFHTFIL